MPSKIDIDRNQIADFCRRHPIQRLSLFGSVLTDRFSNESDIDVLVDFRPGARVTLFDIGGMMNELTEIFGRQADVRTAEDLSRYFRDEVVANAEKVYAA